MSNLHDDELLTKEEVTEAADQELSHTDKMVGVLAEPAVTFEKTALYPPKTIDWLLPAFLFFLAAFLSTVLMLSNPEIAYQLKEKQRAQMEKAFDDAVANGQLTREQADQRIDQQLEMMGGTMGTVLTGAGIFIGGFIVFFIIAGIYFLFSRFVLKGEGTYTSSLAANGLTMYIGLISIIVTAIAALFLGKHMQDLSAASLLDMDRSTITGFIMSKLDAFSIWSYIVLGIGLAKMFKSNNTTKYIIMVVAVWLIGTFLLYLVGKAVPFLSGFAG